MVSDTSQQAGQFWGHDYLWRNHLADGGQFAGRTRRANAQQPTVEAPTGKRHLHPDSRKRLFAKLVRNQIVKGAV